MIIGGLGTTPTLGVLTPWKGVTSDTPSVAGPTDAVFISGSPATAAAAEVSESPAKTSAGRSLMVGLALALSLGGLAGCASTGSMNIPNIQQTVTGGQAKQAFESFTYLDSVAGQDGGIFKQEGGENIKLKPLEALDMFLDGKPVIFLQKGDANPHPVRSWAELQGLQDLVRQAGGGAQIIPQ